MVPTEADLLAARFARMKALIENLGGLLILAFVCATFLSSRPSLPLYIEIQGTLYEALHTGVGPIGPVARAVVSNNWDATTTITDADGHFRLRIRNIAPDEFTVIRAQARDKAACQALTGGFTTNYSVDLFLDGGQFASQRCDSPFIATTVR